MLTNISWTAYLIFVALFLLAWYIIICLRFYSSDILNFVARKTKATRVNSGNEMQPAQYGTTAIGGQAKTPTSLNEEQTDHLFDEVEELSAKIKEAVADASSKEYNKEEFFFLLQITLKAHPQLKGIPFQAAINNLIVSECDKHGFIRPSSEELDMLWIGK